MTLRSQRSIYGHCLGHGSGSWMFKAAREICTISYEVNECMKHMLLNDILQLVVLLDNYTTMPMNTGYFTHTLHNMTFFQKTLRIHGRIL